MLIDVLSGHVLHTLQERNELSKLELIQEIFEFLALKVGEVIRLREDVVYIHFMLPHQVLHVVR